MHPAWLPARAPAQHTPPTCIRPSQVRVWDLDTQHCVQLLVGGRGEVWSLDVDPVETRLAVASSDSELRLYAIAGASGSSSGEDGAAAAAESSGGGGSSAAGATDFLVPMGSVRRQATDRAQTLRYSSGGGGGGSGGLADATLLTCQAAGKVVEVFRVRSEAEARKRLKRRLRRKREKAAAKGGAAGGGGEGSEEEGEAGGVAAAAAAPPLQAAAAEEERLAASDELELVAALRSKHKVRSVAAVPPGAPGARAARQRGTVQLALALANNSLELWEVGPAPPPSGEAGAAAAVAYKADKAQTIDGGGHRSDVRALALASDDSVCLSAAAGSAKLWNPRTGACLRTMESGYGLCAIFAPGDRHAVGGQPRRGRRGRPALPALPALPWPPPPPPPRRPAPAGRNGHPSPAPTLRAHLCAPPCPLPPTVGTKEGTLELFDLNSGGRTAVIPAHDGAVWSLAPLPDRSGFVSGRQDGEGGVPAWHQAADSCTSAHQCGTPLSRVQHPLRSADHDVKFWEWGVEGGGEGAGPRTLTASHTRWAGPATSLLPSVAAGLVQLYCCCCSGALHQQHLTLPSHPPPTPLPPPSSTLKMTDDVLCVRVSPDGRLLAVALLDSTVRVFFADSLKFFLSLYGHKLPVLSMDISSGESPPYILTISSFLFFGGGMGAAELSTLRCGTALRDAPSLNTPPPKTHTHTHSHTHARIRTQTPSCWPPAPPTRTCACGASTLATATGRSSRMATA